MNVTLRNLVLALSSIATGLTFNAAADPAVSAPVPAAALAPSTNVGGAHIQFATPVYDFGRVTAGDAVKYTFIFTNIGTETLMVNNVQPSCGCTTAGEYTKQVEPGKTGMIPIQFNSGSYNGNVLKTVSVTSNDKTQPSVMLQIKGTIWRPIEVAPSYAVLNVTPDNDSASTTVKIVNNTDQPITLSPPESVNPAFSAILKTNQPGKEFEMVISTVPPVKPGGVQGQITIKTSSTNMPVVTVTAWVNAQLVFTVSPPVLNVGQAPLANPIAQTVTIICNSTNLAKLTEPAISRSEVDFSIKEVQPGKVFSISFSFPKGFELAARQPGEFSIKTSNLKAPLIKIPIYQVPHPTVAQTPAMLLNRLPPPGAQPPHPTTGSPQIGAPPPPPRSVNQ